MAKINMFREARSHVRCQPAKDEYISRNAHTRFFSVTAISLKRQNPERFSVSISVPYHVMGTTDLTRVQRRYPGLWRPNEHSEH